MKSSPESIESMKRVIVVFLPSIRRVRIFNRTMTEVLFRRMSARMIKNVVRSAMLVTDYLVASGED